MEFYYLFPGFVCGIFMTSARGALGGQVQKGHWVWEGVFLGETRVD